MAECERTVPTGFEHIFHWVSVKLLSMAGILPNIRQTTVVKFDT